MKRAVLIGSATYGLLGTEKDLELMKELLKPLKFDLQWLEGKKASRAEILAGVEGLIQDSKEGDAALIYYSGHGGLVANPNYDPSIRGQAANVPYYQFLVPTDLAASRAGDFRGLLDLELSDLVARLTDQTQNVTVILDCCHAARQARRGFRNRALPRVWEMDLPDWAKKRHADLKRRYATGNPHAVRLSASGVMESACEYENRAGEVVGMFTESLHLVLSSRDDWDGISWLTAVQWARERVLSLNPSQRVDVEGPARRMIFKTTETDTTGVLRFFYDKEQPSLRGGRLHGVSKGSVYALLPHNAERYEQDLKMGEAKVDKVLGGVSRVSVTPANLQEGGLQAFLMKEASPAFGVCIEGGVPASLLDGIAKSDQLRLLAEDEAEAPLATVRMEAESMQIYDENELPVGQMQREPAPLLADLKLLVRARLLRSFASGQGAFALNEAEFSITWGRVANGEKQPLPKNGTMLALGDAIYIEITNHGQQSLFINVFDLSPRRTISLLTEEQRLGIEIVGGERRVLGFDEDSGDCDWDMIWPEDLAQLEPVPESLIVFLTDHPQDLSALETRAVMRPRAASPTGLQALVERLGLGITRDVRRTRETDVRYAVTSIHFMLDPHSQSHAEATFLCDTRPDRSFLAYATRGLAVQRRLAVRLDELVVHKNRALLSADIRVDMIVTTNSKGTSSEDRYRTGTFRFPNVGDGDQLSFGKLLVFHGTTTDFLDIAIWVSRYKKTSQDLGDLLASRLNDSGLQSAIATLGGPQTAAMGLAVGAVATLVNTAAKLLTATCGHSIGLYRTSFLAGENFGLGRHPRRGQTRIQDFSLAYTIQAVDDADDV